MARERKDLEEHALQGTRPQYTEPDSEVVAARPKFPKEFPRGSSERKLFKQFCRTLEQRRTLTEGDAELLRIVVINRVRHARAMAHILAEGEICTYQRLDSNGQAVDVVKENLWLAVAVTAEKTIVGILDRLGMTPANRGKVKPTKTEKVEDKAGEALLSREEAQKQKDAEAADALLDSVSAADLEKVQ